MTDEFEQKAGQADAGTRDGVGQADAGTQDSVGQTGAGTQDSVGQADPQAAKKTKMKALMLFQEAATVAVNEDLPPEMVEKINESNYSGLNLDSHLGVKYVAAGPKLVSVRLEVGDEHLQPWGVTHGGVYAALGESVGSVASYIAAGAGPAVMGTSNHTDFLRPSKKGDVIVTTATPEHIGRTTQLWRIEHRNEVTGKLVALTHLKTAVIADSKPNF
ncbi:PaaI family thioesterase [Corynebacterium urogenitale]